MNLYRTLIFLVSLAFTNFTFAQDSNKTRSAEEVTQILESVKSDIYTVFKNSLADGCREKGTVVVNFVIEPNGTITDEKIVSPDFACKKLERGILKIISSIEAQTFNGKATHVNYSYNFSPELK